MFENFTDVMNTIENEGLGYFVMDYCSYKDMPDNKSKELFKEATKALTNFYNYIEEKAKEEEYEIIDDFH